MKKLIGVSLLAMLAIGPLSANAAVGDVVSVNDPVHADPATVAQTAPGYALVTEGANDGNVATAGYVKGAYNAAMKAINKVADTAGNAADQNLSNISSAGGDVIKNLAADGAYDNTGSGLTATTIQDAIDEVAATAGTAVQSVTEGTTNGTVSVDGTDIAVHGLGSAAFVDTTAFDAAGDAAAVQTAIEGKLDDGATGYDIDAKSLKVQGADVLTGTSLTDYAKKTGVTQTITNSTISGTVPVLTAWGNDNSTNTVAITASITGATYAEPAGN